MNIHILFDSFNRTNYSFNKPSRKCLPKANEKKKFFLANEHLSLHKYLYTRLF